MAKYNKLFGKHIVIIGGTSDIGRAIAEAGIESGARITIAGSSAQSVDRAQTSIKTAYPSAQLAALSCDLSNESTMEADLNTLLTRAVERNGEIDHIILAVSKRTPRFFVKDITPESAYEGATLLFLLPVLAGKVAGKFLGMAENGAPGVGRNKSLTLTTGTISGKPAPGMAVSAYFAAGINGLMRALAQELAPIRVNSVEPGPVNTARWDAMFGGAENREAGLQKLFSHLPVGKPADVEEVAEAYMYLLRDSNATGEVVRTGGGQHLI